MRMSRELSTSVVTCTPSTGSSPMTCTAPSLSAVGDHLLALVGEFDLARVTAGEVLDPQLVHRVRERMSASDRTGTIECREESVPSGVEEGPAEPLESWSGFEP